MSNQRHVWSEVKNSVGLPLGYCGSSPQLLPLVNEASNLLFNEGDWIHKTARYKFLVGTSCCGSRFITWPHEVETIEFLNICDSPIPIRNTYAEFIGNGVGNIGELGGTLPGYGGPGYFNFYGGRFRMLGDREEVCTFEDINGPNKKLMVYNSLPADNGVQVILLGYDQNNQWIRTLQDGVYTDGEYLTCNTASPPTTTNFFSSVKGVQFSTTPRNGVINLVGLDTMNAQQRTIASYQYNERIPIYRRSILSGAQFSKCLCVVGLVRLRFVPIMFDTDYLQIGNLAALKSMLIALTKRDNGDAQNYLAFKKMATDALDNELSQYQGKAPKKIMNWQSRGLWGSAANLR
jgi:hypothetical protein